MDQGHEWAFVCPAQDIELALSRKQRHSEAFRVKDTLSYGLQFHPETSIPNLEAKGLDHEECVLIAELGRKVIQAWVTLVLESEI